MRIAVAAILAVVLASPPATARSGSWTPDPARLAALRAAGFTVTATAADDTVLVPAGDLDGDGRTDLVESWLERVDAEFYGNFAARGSRTGRVIWHRRIPGLYFALRPSRVGRDAGHGLLITIDRLRAGAATDVSRKWTTTFLALDRAGRDVWSRGYEWDNAGSARWVQPWLTAVGNVSGGASDDLLVTFFASAHLQGHYVWSGRAVVLDGSDGAERPTGLPTAVVDVRAGLTQVGGPAHAGTRPIVPSLAGGRVMTGTVSQPGLAVVAAYRVGETTADWTAAVPVDMPDGVVTAIGDVTGDGTTDLALLSRSTAWPTELAVLDGRDGRALFTRAGRTAFRVRAGQVMVADSTSNHDGATITWSRLDAAGKVLQAATTRVTSRLDVAGADAGMMPAGDVQGDGYLDAVFNATFIDSSSKLERRAGVVDGRTGRVLWYGHQLIPLGGDVIDFDTSTAGRVVIARVDGATGRTVWRATVPFAGFLLLETNYVNLDGDNVPDVLVDLFGTRRFGTIGLSGATGRVLARSGPF